MAINALAPEVHCDGKRLPRYDAIIPRIGAPITLYGTAVIRQFETIGTFVVNPSEGITASRDKLYAHQILARHRIGMPATGLRGLAQGYREPDRAGGIDALDREALGKHPAGRRLCWPRRARRRNR